MLRIISQMVEMLLSDWYPSIQPKVWIICTACMQPHFTRQQCCQATQQSPLYCSAEQQMMFVKEVAPDLTFEDFPEFPLLQENELLFELDEGGQRKQLGKGSFHLAMETSNQISSTPSTQNPTSLSNCRNKSDEKRIHHS